MIDICQDLKRIWTKKLMKYLKKWIILNSNLKIILANVDKNSIVIKSILQATESIDFN